MPGCLFNSAIMEILSFDLFCSVFAQLPIKRSLLQLTSISEEDIVKRFTRFTPNPLLLQYRGLMYCSYVFESCFLCVGAFSKHLHICLCY